ncbi:MAG: class I mannose-6-phosphate isomerase [Sandaracinaceae bacterium]|nr:class I mannose-6-phosphate isomerase [Sandaracinaceae bacterium]
MTRKPPSPILLRADNFTPPSRTPWGGTTLRSTLKAHAPLAADKAAYAVVGESWEVSVEPDFPSVDELTSLQLDEHIRGAPAEWLGREHAAGKESTALLVKLIDAADELSVQIHPNDSYTGLHAGESGKPESWYVVACEYGAGIYLGLSESTSRDSMALALAREADVSKHLQFIPVEPGDFFLIEAGTAHAIGRGLILVEPQHVTPGKRGVTYRYWDWNRRYDKDGKLDRLGSARALHVKDALAVTAWDAPRGSEFLHRARLQAGTADLDGPPSLLPLCGPTHGLLSSHLEVSRLAGNGRFRLPAVDALRGLTVVDGSITLHAEARDFVVAKGRSAALPACLSETPCTLSNAHVILSSIP